MSLATELSCKSIDGIMTWMRVAALGSLSFPWNALAILGDFPIPSPLSEGTPPSSLLGNALRLENRELTDSTPCSSSLVSKPSDWDCDSSWTEDNLESPIPSCSDISGMRSGSFGKRSEAWSDRLGGPSRSKLGEELRVEISCVELTGCCWWGLGASSATLSSPGVRSAALSSPGEWGWFTVVLNFGLTSPGEGGGGPGWINTQKD